MPLLRLRFLPLALPALLALGPPARAFLSFNNGHDQFHIDASYGYYYDSNLFANSLDQGDYYQSLSLGLEYARNAGLIGINSTLKVDDAIFSKYRDENYKNPTFTLGFSKDTGRVTGTFSFSVQRQSRSDEAANIRDTSWYYTGDLAFKYPLSERYFISTDSQYSQRNFQNNQLLFNLRTLSEGVNMNYVYTSKLDLIGGYRIRYSNTFGGGYSYDHAFTIGASGKILPKLSGTISAGYQLRDDYSAGHHTYGSTTAGIGLTWPISTFVTFGGQFSEDFSTTSTAISVDSTTGVLSANWKISDKLAVHTDTGVSYGRYLGALGAGRRDTTYFADAGVTYALTARFNLALAYSISRTSSTFQFSDFTRHTVSLSLSARF